ncbi:MAG: hypothetical protein Q8P59_05255 [Dehalococcoidia bacterium]|nr:hypothetical protein [Dehalococcoidia bacterium]
MTVPLQYLAILACPGDSRLASTVGEELARELRMIPLPAGDDSLVVVSATPMDQSILEGLSSGRLARLLPAALSRQHQVVPLFRDGPFLFAATPHLLRPQAVAELEAVSGLTIKQAPCASGSLRKGCAVGQTGA